MPRKARADLHPMILLADKSDVAGPKRTIEANGFRVGIYKTIDIDVNYRCCYRVLKSLSRSVRGLDFRVLLELANLLNQSKSFPVDYEKDEPQVRGMVKHRFAILGCRIRFTTLNDLARSIGVHPSHLKRQLPLMRKSGILVNGGHGWLDLNPNIFWMGSAEEQTAFCRKYYPMMPICNHWIFINGNPYMRKLKERTWVINHHS
jgi:hypothetical protein